jgi:rare lipoprotein A
MRTFVKSTVAAATLGLMAVVPAKAATHWECMGSYVACGSSGAYGASSRNYRSQGRIYADRADRRLSRRASSPRLTAERTEPRKPVRVAKAETAGTRVSASSESANPPPARAEKPVRVAGGGKTQSGMASYYGTESGSRTASGARYNPSAMTAAHRTLPFGTKVRVTNKRNGRSVVVRINDRGPFVRGRVIDVTPHAAGVLGFSGLTPVSLEVVRGG